MVNYDLSQTLIEWKKNVFVFVNHSPILGEIGPHRNHSFLYLNFGWRWIQTEIKETEMEQISQLITVTNTRSGYAHESLVQTQCTVETKSIEKRCPITDGMQSCSIHDTSDEHCIGQELHTKIVKKQVYTKETFKLHLSSLR